MGILLWVVGALALGAGAIKLRSGTTALVGRSPLALAEIVAGLLLVAGAGAGLARQRGEAWLCVLATLVLIVTSAVAHGRRVSRHREERDRSAEQRFRQYLGEPWR